MTYKILYINCSINNITSEFEILNERISKILILDNNENKSIYNFLSQTLGEVTKIHTLFCLSLSHHFVL